MAARAVIVGASLGGLRAMEGLVASGVDPASITIVGDELYRPYNRPPLSKEMLSETSNAGAGSDFAKLAFKIRPALEAAQWLLGRKAQSVSLVNRCLVLSDGTEIRFDALVAATGLTPRRLPFDGAWGQRFVLRTLDDAIALRSALKPGTRVVVIGAGFIGCEAAATARKHGCTVTVAEAFETPMERAIGPVAGTALQRLHEDHGITFKTSVSVTGWDLDPSGKLTGVALSTGEVIPADVVIEAVGSIANVGWLEGQGLNLENGLLCDNWLRVEGRPDVYAVGDVARFPNPRFDDVCRRIEHWCVPGQTARRAAETLAAHFANVPPRADVFRPMPTFWSDQHGLRIQSFGLPALGETIEILEGSLDSADSLRRGAAIGYRRAGEAIGAVTIGLPPDRAIQHRNFLRA